MSIFWLLIAFAALIVWVVLLILENVAYYKKVLKKAQREKARIEAQKKKVKEFKWPDDLPFHF